MVVILTRVAIVASEAGKTDASVTVLSIDTLSAVLAGTGRAFLDIDLAEKAVETLGTFALESVHQIQTLAAVLTDHTLAFVDVCEGKNSSISLTLSVTGVPIS